MRDGFYTRAEGQSAEVAGHLQSELFEQLEERGRLVAARTDDGEPEPSAEAIAALTPLLVEESLAAAATLVEDVEGVRARGRQGSTGRRRRARKAACRHLSRQYEPGRTASYTLPQNWQMRDGGRTPLVGGEALREA